MPSFLRALPRLSVLLWLAFFLGLMLTNWRVVFISADGDPSMHRRMGEWMLEHHTVLRTEQFLHTRLGDPFIQKEWLSQVLYTVAGRLGGWTGFVALGALLLATTLYLLNDLLRRQGATPLVATLVALLAGYAGAMHWMARPHLFTQLLVIVLIWLLWRFDTGSLRSGRLMLGVGIMMVPWVNLHGGFLAAFIIIGGHMAGQVISAGLTKDDARREHIRKALVLAGAIAVALVASLANPNGWELTRHIGKFLFADTDVARSTNEFASPNFHSGGTRGFLLLLFTLAVALMIRRPRLTPTEIVLVGGFGYMSLQSVRHVPLFALVTAPVLARLLQEGLRDGGWPVIRRLSERVARIDQASNGWGWIPVAALAIGLVVVVPVQRETKTILETDILDTKYPVAAVRWLQENQPLLPGEMFNEYHWGGYLMWAMPERKPFIDGRNDFYGATLLKEFDIAGRAEPGWENVFQQFNVGWTILPREHPLNSVLELDPLWRTVYTDEVTTVFCRD
jgi:hypothetical protein